MAAGIMPKIGEPVTCDGPCKHRDCKLTRELAATPCSICDKIIRAGARYYLRDNKPVHASCVEAEISFKHCCKMFNL